MDITTDSTQAYLLASAELFKQTEIGIERKDFAEAYKLNLQNLQLVQKAYKENSGSVFSELISWIYEQQGDILMYEKKGREAFVSYTNALNYISDESFIRKIALNAKKNIAYSEKYEDYYLMCGKREVQKSFPNSNFFSRTESTSKETSSQDDDMLEEQVSKGCCLII